MSDPDPAAFIDAFYASADALADQFETAPPLSTR